MSRDSKLKCLACGGNLVAIVTLTKAMPLAGRNGTVLLSGVKIGQIDMKQAWDYVGPYEGAAPRKIKGPIHCEECEEEHYYIVGDKKPLRLGDVATAREAEYEET